MGLNDMPNEILLKIIASLPLADQYGPKTRLVCKRWNQLMGTKIYRRIAYTRFVLSEAVKAEAAPSSGSTYKQKVIPALMAKYTTKFTRQIVVAEPGKEIAQLLKDFGQLPTEIHAVGKTAAKFLELGESLSQIHTVFISTKMSTFPSKLKLTRSKVQLPNCRSVNVTNCNLSLNDMAILFDLPALKRLRIKDVRPLRFKRRLRRMRQFLTSYKSNQPKIVHRSKEVQLTVNNRTFKFLCKNGEFEIGDRFRDYYRNPV